jgi:hypothetical protein
MAVLCVFDLLELDGQDFRRLRVELRKAGLTPAPFRHFRSHHALLGAQCDRKLPALSAMVAADLAHVLTLDRGDLITAAS